MIFNFFQRMSKRPLKEVKASKTQLCRGIIDEQRSLSKKEGVT